VPSPSTETPDAIAPVAITEGKAIATDRQTNIKLLGLSGYITFLRENGCYANSLAPGSTSDATKKS